MKTQLLDLVALLAALLVPNSAFAQGPATAARPVGLLGAGATLPAPLYKQWIGAYRKLEPQTTIEYNDVGSGEGTKRFLDGAVDFGASGAALTDEQITAARSGAVGVPARAGAAAAGRRNSDYSFVPPTTGPANTKWRYRWLNAHQVRLHPCSGQGPAGPM